MTERELNLQEDRDWDIFKGESIAKLQKTYPHFNIPESISFWEGAISEGWQTREGLKKIIEHLLEGTSPTSTPL